MQNTSYYVYYYLRSKDGISGKKDTPYYVGKGKGKRITTKRARITVPKDPAYRIKIAEGLTEEQAHKIERVHVKLWGRIDLGTGILHNLTDGGEGTSGYKHTEEQRKIRAQINSDIWSRPNVRAKHRKSVRKAFNKPEYREKRKYLDNLPERKIKHTEACRVAHNMPEVKLKKSQSMKATASTPEYKENRKKVNDLPTTKANRSKAMKEVASRPGHLEKRLASFITTNSKPEIKEKRSKSAKLCNNKPEKIEHQREVANRVNRLRRLDVPFEQRLKPWNKNGECVYSVDHPGDGWALGKPPLVKKPCIHCGKLLGQSAMHRKACERVAGMIDAEL